MKISDRKYILILLILVLGLGLVSYWRFQKFSQPLAEITLPKIEAPEMRLELEEFFLLEKESKQEWISPDGKLKLTYSAIWLKMDEVLFGYDNEAWIMLKESKVLFFAYQFKIKEQISVFLTVNEVSAEKTLEEIIKETEENTKERDGEIEITILEFKDEIVWLEMNSKYPGQPSFYSKGKIIFSDEKTYLIIFTGPQVNWPQFEGEAKEILESARLL